MPDVTLGDVSRMRETLLYDGPRASRKLTRFWTLLPLATVIAAGGVVSDSTATVIGAMIVAPLMTPILAAVLSIVTGDRANILRSLVLVVSGSASAIVIGYLVGLLVPLGVTADTSSQVAGRVSPTLMDLIVALATGAVGAFAQCRDDIADTLPGVAIAISLVPPLAVVGLTAEAGALDQSLGALLLFGTNVAAILVSGCAVMALFRVPLRSDVGAPGRSSVRRALAAVVAFAVVVAIPLTASTVSIIERNEEMRAMAEVADVWAAEADWRIVSVVAGEHGAVIVRTVGPLPEPDPDLLRGRLDAAGFDGRPVSLEMVPERRVELAG